MSMKVEGVYRFKADRDIVWTKLCDPDVIAGCIPGCREFNAVGEDLYEVALTMGVGAISGSYTGSVAVIDKEQPSSFKMVVEGTGSGGSIKGESVLSLRALDDGTEVEIEGEAQVTGIVARVGQRFLGSASKMLIKQFFDCMKEKIEHG